MLFTRKIEIIIEGAICSAYVIEEGAWRPVNVMFVSRSGGGRSSLLMEIYGQVDGVKTYGDITYDGLAKREVSAMHKGRIRTGIMPEFNKILGRRASTARNTVGLLMEISEEGCPSIDLPFYSRRFNPPARANFLIGCTPSFFKAHLLSWWGMGFLQRFLLVTWDYSTSQIDLILDSIARGMQEKTRPWKGEMPEPNEVKIPYKIASKLKAEYTQRIVEDTTDYVRHYCELRRIPFNAREEEELPFRTQMRLQRFIKGLALRDGRTRVKSKDYSLFKQLFVHMNLKLRTLTGLKVTRKRKLRRSY